jgi:hypothetical protein
MQSLIAVKFLVVPLMWYGRRWVDNHPQSELLAEYLYSGPWVTGLWLVPKRLNRKKLMAERQELYEGFLRLGRPVPEEYLPGNWHEEGLLEYRLVYKRALRNVEKETEAKVDASRGGFKPEILVMEKMARPKERVVDKDGKR